MWVYMGDTFVYLARGIYGTIVFEFIRSIDARYSYKDTFVDTKLTSSKYTKLVSTITDPQIVKGALVNYRQLYC